MEMRKALLVKTLKGLLKMTVFSVTTTNADHKYPTGREQNEFELRNVEGCIEKIWHILRSCVIKSISYSESTLRKLFYKLNNRVATENKNNLDFENDCSNGKAVCFCEFNQFLKLRSD